MTSLIDHVALLTSLRDREVLDCTLATALADLLQPQALQVVRVVGDEGEERWFSRARIARGSPEVASDPVWARPEDLPELAERPQWRDALRAPQPLTQPGPPALSHWPLLTDLGPVGVLELQSDAPLQPAEMDLVGDLLKVYRNVLGLLDYSERDTLTGLLNRKSFDETFLQATVVEADRLYGDAPEAGRRQGGAMPHWLGLLDIDHFKLVNDRFGHLIGDEVLVLVARLLRSAFRFGDRLYRFGGEEFVVLLAAPDEAAAAAAFERLRLKLEAFAFPQVGRVTASIGFSDVRAGDTPQAAFERADRAVYHAKQNGRNQVQSFGALVAGGLMTDDTSSGDVELF